MEKYVKIKQIGEGSFGKALLMKRKEDGKMCVIKEIGISKMSRKEQEDSKKEVKVLSQLNHANIVSYQESFEGKGNLYIVMDYCEGGDLHQYIKNQRGVPIEENKVFDIFIQCCLAIKYIHDRKILHRDIKTQNIFLTKDNTVKLGDFGIARVLKSTMELAHTCIGTPYYLSPEIVENRPYNNKSDIWSLGCVLYEMVTLKHAFEAGNMKNLVMKIVRGSYPPISNRYSFEIRSLVAQTFKRSPSDRPSINTILKKPVIQKKLEKFVSREKLEEEFRDIPVQKPKPKPQAPVSVVEPSAKKGMAVKRRDDIANIYGASVAKKPVPNRKPTSAQQKKVIQRKLKSSNENTKEIAARERRRQNLVEAERKHLDQMKKMQKERWQKQNLQQMKIARGAGWRNILGVPGEEVKEKKAEDNLLVDDQQKKQQIVKEEAVNKNICKEEKMIFPVKNVLKDPVESKPINPFAKQMNAWEAPQKPQVNIVEGNLNCDRAKLLEDYWQRKKEADSNKMRVNQDMYGKVNWKPPNPNNNNNKPGGGGGGGIIIKHKPPPAYPSARNKQEQEYLRQLEAIRYQNFIERRVSNQKGGKDANHNLRGDPRFDPEARKQKIQDLKKQADERGAVLLQRCKNERQVLRKPEERLVNNFVMDRKPDNRPLPAQKIKKEEMITPPMGIDTAMREVNQPKLFRSCSEGDLQEAIKKAGQLPRKNWPASNIKSFGLGNLPMEITGSAMEATSEDDKECVLIQPVIDRNEKRKYWVHEGKTQLVANLRNKEINATQAPTMFFEATIDDDNLNKMEPSTNISIVQENVNEIKTSGKTVTINESGIDSTTILQKISASKEVTSATSPVNNEHIESVSNNLITSSSNKTITVSSHTNSNTITYPTTTTTTVSPVSVKHDDNISTSPSTDTYVVSSPRSFLPKSLNDSTRFQNVDNKLKESSRSAMGNNGATVVLSSKDIGASTVELPSKDKGTSTVLSSDEKVASTVLPSEEKVAGTVVLPSKDKSTSSVLSSEDKDTATVALPSEDKGTCTGILSSEDDISKSNDESIESNDTTSVLVSHEKPVQQTSPLQDASTARTDVFSGECSEGGVSENIECYEDTIPEEIEYCEDHVTDKAIVTCEENLHRSIKAPVEAWTVCITPEVEKNETNMASILDNIGRNDDTEEEFHTPNRTFGLQTGVYDTEKQLLRTCSMPELNTFVSLLPDNNDTEDESALPCVNLTEEYSLDNEDEDASNEKIKGDENEMNLEEFDDEEVDDYTSMLESMNDLLSNTDEDNTNDGNDTNEEDCVDWESDEDENEVAKEKDMKCKEDLFSRNEESRKTLEDELGLELFLKVYKHLQSIQDDESDELELGTVEISNLLGDKDYLYQKILYLVMADAAYCEGNDGLE